MAEEDVYARAAQAAREAAALTMLRGVKPPGTVTRPPGKDQGSTEKLFQAASEFIIPQSPFDVGMMVAGGPVGGKVLRTLAPAIGAMLSPEEAQASFRKAMGLLAPNALGTKAKVKAPAILPSEFERPLFDYSRMEEVPDVPQFGLPRIKPARGIPEYALRLGDPTNMERVNAIVQMGMAHGGPEWYNTMPLRERYIGELGAAKGQEGWESGLKYTGATSPRTPVPQNIRIGSLYDMLAAQDLPFPQAVFRRGNWSVPKGELPPTYGSLAQASQANNAALIREQGGWPAWTFFGKPKPPSFTTNLMGNYWPVTSDVHNVGMLSGGRMQMPPHQLYDYVERLQQGPLGAQQFIDLAPAQYQASGWIPWAAGYRTVGRYGDVTGGSPARLAAYSDPYIKVVENLVKSRARGLGETPEQTLRRYLRKEIALAGAPAAAIPALEASDQE